jgi:hypothetical protein
MLDADRLSAIVTRHLREHGAALGLDVSRVVVEYVLNAAGTRSDSRSRRTIAPRAS